MKDSRFLVPTVTPFRDDGSINYDALKKLVRYVLDEGADGIYAGGASSEFVFLTEEEREKVVETVVRAADGATVVAHVGDTSTDKCERLARHAKKVGADGVSAVPPFWYGYTIDEIADYYRVIADAAELPVMIYNIPACSGVKFTTEQFCKILSDERIVSVKYTDTDYFTMERIIQHTGKTVYSGCDQCFLSAIAAGAKGAIGTTFNFMMKKYIAIYDAFTQGDNQKALEIMTSTNNITEEIVKNNCIQTTKYLLTLIGIEAGVCRRPFRPLSAADKLALQNAYEKNI